jgi:hypothetical protein
VTTVFRSRPDDNEHHMFCMPEFVVAPRHPRRQALFPELLSHSLRRRAKRLAEAVQARRVLHLCYGGVWRVMHPHALGRTGRGRLGLLVWQTAGVIRGVGNEGEGWRLFHVARIEKVQFLHASFVPSPRAPGRGWTAAIVAPAAEVPPRDEFLAEVAICTYGSGASRTRSHRRESQGLSLSSPPG